MSLRKYLFVATIIIIITFCFILGSSYAWYTVSGGSTDFKSVTTEADLNIIYAQDKIVKTTTSIPINDSMKERLADSNVFTVSVPEELKDYRISLRISLINITIDEELKNKAFKYELLQDNNIISSGNGLDFIEKAVILKNNIEIDPTKTYTFSLRIWLSETGESQNDLMNKNFQGQIQVDSIAKR